MRFGGLLEDLTVGATVRLVAPLFPHTGPDAEILELAEMEVGDHDTTGAQRRQRHAVG